MPDNVRDVWSDDELDTALAALRSDVHTDQRALGRSYAELMATARGDVQVAATAPASAPTRSRRSLRWTVAAAAVAVVASLLLTQFGSGPPVASAAAQQLNSAADKIGAHDEPIGPGQYRYVATRAWDTQAIDDGRGVYPYMEEHLTEIWMPADWRQVWLQRDTTTGKRKWLVGSQRAAGEAALGPARRETSQSKAPYCDLLGEREGFEPCAPGNWDLPDWQFLASLPRDPEKLYDDLRRQPGADSAAGMLGYLSELLGTGLVPADLRAVMYRTLGMVPGLEITEKVANLDGRTGIAFGATDRDDGTRQDVIIDPETGQFIGEREVTTTGFEGVAPGTTVEYTSVTTAVVEDMGDKPTG